MKERLQSRFKEYVMSHNIPMYLAHRFYMLTDSEYRKFTNGMKEVRELRGTIHITVHVGGALRWQETLPARNGAEVTKALQSLHGLHRGAEIRVTTTDGEGNLLNDFRSVRK